MIPDSFPPISQEKELMEILKGAVDAVGLPRVKMLLPEHLEMHYEEHKTGCKMRISPSNPSLYGFTVWAGSIWRHSFFSSFDSGVSLGLQRDCEWAGDLLREFFWNCQRLLEDYVRGKSEVVQQHLSTSDQERTQIIDMLRKDLNL